MKFQTLLQSFSFEDIFPTLAVMYPNAKRHRKEFETAYEILTTIRPILSKKTIKYQLIESETAKSYYYGALDSSFKASWEVLAGKDIVKQKPVDLTDEEIAANSLLCAIFIGQHPAEFESAYNVLVRT